MLALVGNASGWALALVCISISYMKKKQQWTANIELLVLIIYTNGNTNANNLKQILATRIQTIYIYTHPTMIIDGLLPFF